MTMLIPVRDHNPYRRFPIVTVAVIAANVWVFFAVPLTDQTAFHFGAVPCDVLQRCAGVSARLRRTFPDRAPLETLFTSMFVHGSIAHLAGNMLYLWVFGNNVEDRLGHVAYSAFYLVCGVAAGATHIFVSSGSAIPTIGASGAVSGVLGAYLVLWPRARVVTIAPILLFIPVEVSASFLLGMWFVLQLLSGLAGIGNSAQSSGVAFFAHVGGFAAGWLLVRMFASARRPDPIQRLMA